MKTPSAPPPRLRCRLSPKTLACLAAAGFFLMPVDMLLAQALPGGNPVDQLPAPQTGPTQRSGARTGIGQAQVPQQAGPSRNITPQRFDIAGVNALAFEDIAAIFQPLVNKPVTVADLVEKARQATALYQQRGYALSFVFIPQQDFEGGVVRVTAVEGHVAKLQIEGDAGGAEPKMRELAGRIMQDKPLTRESFERYTQIIAQQPGVRVEATATPPTQTDGAGALELKASRQPYSISVGTDIRSSKPRAVITGVLNDPVASGSRLTASTLLGGLKGESFLAGSYSQMAGTEGLIIKGDISSYKGDPDAQLSTPPAIRRFTTYKRAEVSASYPLILAQSRSLFMSGGVYGVNNADEYSNPATGLLLTDDVRVRAIYAQTAYNTAHDDQSRSLSARVVQGLKGMGASSSIRTNAAGAVPVNPAKLDFTRLVLSASQRDTWDKTWGTAVGFNAQYTPHTLPSTERVSYGSGRFGRAYTAGVIAGDSGYGVSLEGNRTFAVDMKYVKRIQPYLLLERARVSVHTGALTFSRLTSASLGARISDGAYYTLDVALSKPLDASFDNPRKNLRLSTLLTYNFEKR